jgi:hypothetical protein
MTNAIYGKKSLNSGLQKIPGVGPSIEKDLLDLGICRIDDLKGESPDDLYARLCSIKNARVDRCVLYVFRCAVYYAEKKVHDPMLLKWWNWKDK